MMVKDQYAITLGLISSSLRGLKSDVRARSLWLASCPQSFEIASLFSQCQKGACSHIRGRLSAIAYILMPMENKIY